MLSSYEDGSTPLSQSPAAGIVAGNRPMVNRGSYNSKVQLAPSLTA
jgi:hypothetical protein